LRSRLCGASLRRFRFRGCETSGGVFTVQPDPDEDLPLDIAKKIIIDKKRVRMFRSILFQCGMDYAYIYPDEEGIGQQLKCYAKSNAVSASRAARIATETSDSTLLDPMVDRRRAS
jgi:hypothetical protein